MPRNKKIAEKNVFLPLKKYSKDYVRRMQKKKGKENKGIEHMLNSTAVQMHRQKNCIHKFCYKI